MYSNKSGYVKMFTGVATFSTNLIIFYWSQVTSKHVPQTSNCRCVFKNSDQRSKNGWAIATRLLLNDFCCKYKYKEYNHQMTPALEIQTHFKVTFFVTYCIWSDFDRGKRNLVRFSGEFELWGFYCSCCPKQNWRLRQGRVHDMMTRVQTFFKRTLF